MLVLTRNKNESIVIAGNIEIVVVEVRGDKVRLGINAPKEVSVHRKEVHEAILRGDAAKDVDSSLLKMETLPRSGRVFFV